MYEKKRFFAVMMQRVDFSKGEATIEDTVTESFSKE